VREPAPEDGLPYFLQGYEPVGIKETCASDPIGPDQLAVWVNRTGEWEEMDVDRLWKGKRGTESLCRHLVTNLLGMTAAQYDSMKDAFDQPDTSERIGIYRMEEGGVMNYVIVVRMVPRDYKALLQAGAAGATAAGALAYYLSRKKKTDQKYAESNQGIKTWFDETGPIGQRELKLRQFLDAAERTTRGIAELRNMTG
jgi:hypothetical protein